MIRLRGAREHNLRGIDLDLPKGTLIAFTGVSGSGKSSLAFDTLYAEASRRFVEALAPEARSRFGRLRRPAVTFVDGLPPAIGVSQRGRSAPAARATVASEAEIHELLRVVWATVGVLHCPDCGTPSRPATVDSIVRELVSLAPGTRVSVLAPVVRAGRVAAVLRELPRQGFVRVRLDGVQHAVEDVGPVDDRVPHDLDVVVDRVKIAGADEADRLAEQRSRLGEAVRTVQRIGRSAGRGEVVVQAGGPDRVYGAAGRCGGCSAVLPELHARLFSTSSPKGACRSCDGLGAVRTVDADRLVVDPLRSLAEGAVDGGKAVRDAAHAHGIPMDRAWRDLDWASQDYVLRGGPGWEGAGRRASRRGASAASERAAMATLERPCADCASSGLAPAGRSVRVGSALRGSYPEWVGSPEGGSYPVLGRTLPELLMVPLSELVIDCPAPEVAPLVDEINRRVAFLVRVGLGHLTLGRSASTLSTGESQRVRIASQAGSQLSGVMYVFDEPTAGLHPADTALFLDVLRDLRAAGNTVLVVEHDPDVIRIADLVVDIGPGAGPDGGQLLYFGPPSGLAGRESPTARWLDGRDSAAPPLPRQVAGVLTLTGARGRNLTRRSPAGVDLVLPLGQVTAVTGRSGVGKSTLVLDTLAAAVARHLGALAEPLPYDRLDGLDAIGRLVRVGLAQAARSDRSLPVTLLKLWADLRGLYAKTALARQHGWGPDHWSLHTSGSGRCTACEGEGVRHVDLQFLPEVAVECEACEGQRYDEATLSVTFHGLSMAQVLTLPAREARVLFANHQAIAGPLRVLEDLGLGYLPLGQPASTLSGGEQQRIQLARELGRPGDVAGTLYVLDEPSIGLHPADIASLLTALHRLADARGTVIVVDTDPALVLGCDNVVEL